MNRSVCVSAALFAVLTTITGAQYSAARPAEETREENALFHEETKMIKKTTRTDKEWKNILTPEQYRVLRQAGTETAVFAAGCFWGVEDKFGGIKGVLSTRVGYAGGHTKDPTYQRVCSDATGHAESVEVVFDPGVVSYTELLDAFFRFHDPTQVNRQGPDVGTQYRSAVFYQNEAQKEAALKAIAKLNASGQYDRPVATQVLPASGFYQAEEYHQKYCEKLGKRK
jgi:methionine-S-sulfoxide reductase